MSDLTSSHGTLVSGGAITGRLHRANDMAEVTALMRGGELAETVLLVDSPSATAVVPLLAQVRGVVCRSGGSTSHLALVSREFGLTCVMGAVVDPALSGDGESVRIDDEGRVSPA